MGSTPMYELQYLPLSYDDLIVIKFYKRDCSPDSLT